MTGKELVLRRMTNQRMVGGGTGTPEELLGRMGCIQAQDFAQAKWAIGVRGAAVAEADVDAAFQDGRILRTHVLRPTWHFVLPSDIRWMLALTAPRIRKFCQPYHKKLELDAAVFKRSRKVLEKTLGGGRMVTRIEIGEAFGRAKINTDDIRMNFLLMDAELEGLICSGPRKGRQFTYALLEERASAAPVLAAEQAVGELAARYFSSRGPATVADFAWWSGLTIGETKRGWEMVKGGLERTVMEKKEYWFSGDRAAAGAVPAVLLLPAFDEYLVAYKERTDVLARAYEKESSHGLKPVVLVNGRVTGVWRREIKDGESTIEVSLFEKKGNAVQASLRKQAERYAKFAGGKLAAFQLQSRSGKAVHS